VSIESQLSTGSELHRESQMARVSKLCRGSDIPTATNVFQSMLDVLSALVEQNIQRSLDSLGLAWGYHQSSTLCASSSSAKCKSVWKPQANFPDTLVNSTSAPKSFLMLPGPP